jgi:hypothetical protein
VDDAVDAVEAFRHQVGVTDVSDDELGLGVQVVGCPLMYLRIERIENPDLVAALHESVDDIGADEPRTARDENSHAGRLGQNAEVRISLVLRRESQARSLSTWGRAAVATATVTAVAVVSFLPRLSSPIDRLVNVKSNGPAPSYEPDLNDAGIRAAGEIVPDDPNATYALESPRAYGLDLLGAGLLYLLPAMNVGSARDAEWILAYGVEARIPPTSRILHRYRLSDNTTLVHVKPA